MLPPVFETVQATAQAVPLSVNAVGLAVLPVCVAWNPKPVEPPGVIVAFHAEVTVCPLGSVKARAQPLIAAPPLFLTVTSVVNPVFQAFNWYVTEQALPDGGGLDDGDGDAEVVVGDGEVAVPPSASSVAVYAGFFA